jgi:GT2 family glycosyltransferase
VLVAGLPGDGPRTAAILRSGAANPIHAHVTEYETVDSARYGVALVPLPAAALQGEWSLVLSCAGEEAVGIPADQLVDHAVDVEVLIDRALAGGDRASREHLAQNLMMASMSALEQPEGFTLAHRLHRLRNALREPLAERIIDAEAPQVAFIDTILAVDERSFWIAGWIRDADRTATVTAISPEGQRADLLEGAFRFTRPDVDALFAGQSRQETGHGLVNLITLPAPSVLDRGWLVEMHDGLRRGVEAPVPEVVRDRMDVMNRILSEFAAERLERERLRSEHVRPALERLRVHGRKAVVIDETRDYGTLPKEPRASVVVPLYERVDLVEHQLAQFGRDPDFADVELVYVLDSPELSPELLRDAPHLHSLHRIPFRVVLLNRNSGFSIANNLGVGQTRAPLVLLLNSDVIPATGGWLERMCRFYESTPGIGALGAKLLFEDDSIQHAGMYFERDLDSGAWSNRHYFKGFHRDFAEARISRPVPGVTGACLLIDRRLYEEHGGLSEAYVRGGYEDSDLCIRLMQAGQRNWYLADVELYHLEAQSYPSPVRHVATLYNGWLQTQLWNSVIRDVMASHKGDGGSTLPLDSTRIDDLNLLPARSTER